MVYANANPAYPLQNYSVVVVKSNFWPGAVTFFSEGQWSQIYVGDGLKHEPARFFPLSAPTIIDDPVEVACKTDVSLFDRITSFSHWKRRKSRWSRASRTTMMTSDDTVLSYSHF